MIATIEDAERAVRENPQDLRTLSMAADLLQDLGDPRGEDFAACLLGTITAEEVMRRYSADVTAMYYAAWAMAKEEDECSTCREWIGVGQIPDDHSVRKTTWSTCPQCRGTGSNGNAARAEALRLLAECGKVGRPGFGYDDPFGREDDHDFLQFVVPAGWWYTCLELVGVEDRYRPVGERLALLDAYAAADTDTRRQWAAETRALSATGR